MPENTAFAPQDRPDAPSAGSLVPSPPPARRLLLPRLGPLGKCRQPMEARTASPLGHKRRNIYAYYTFFVYFTCWRGILALAKSQIKKVRRG